MLKPTVSKKQGKDNKAKKPIDVNVYKVEENMDASGQRKFFMSKLKVQVSQQSGETQTFTQGNDYSIINLATP